MKKFFTILFSIIFFHLGFSQTNPIVSQIIESVSIDSLTKFVNELSGEIPVVINGNTVTITTRYYNSASNNLAADYVKQKFEGYGLQAYDQTFNSGRNVYAVQTGSTYPDQIYIICAHYDDMPSSGLAPGADDNGSGTAAVIEAARILKDYELKYTVIYAVWDAEELGLLGSHYYAQQASGSSMNIQGVVNMDMIAYDSNNDGKAEIHTKNIAGSVAMKDSMLKINNDYSIGVTASVINPGLTASDHASFWTYNYSAILLIENYYGDFNAYYHSSSDLISHFNFPYFEKCAKLSIGTFGLLAKPESALPVELTNFTAGLDNHQIILQWTTATEVNNSHFEIERRINLNKNVFNWQTIGSVQGCGNKSISTNYTFTDSKLELSGKYSYRLKQVDFNGSFKYSPEVEINVVLANKFALEQNYPNPFNPSTRITFSVPVKEHVSLIVYDMLGNQVLQLVNEIKESGSFTTNFDASNLPSGIYFYKMQAGNFVEMKKMVLLK